MKKLRRRKKSLKAWVKELKTRTKDSDSFTTQDTEGKSITITWRKITDIKQLSHEEKETMWQLSRNPFIANEIQYLKTQKKEDIFWPRLKPYF